MDTAVQCKKCAKQCSEYNSIKCQYCKLYMCDPCFKDGFFLRKSVYCVVSFRVSCDDTFVDMNKLRNDEFVYACSHLCQFRLARNLMTSR